MRTTADRGRVYRRCGCRDIHRRQLGAHCPRLLTDHHHGTWTFAVDIPAPHHRRTTVRRGGFTSHDAAQAALRTFLEGEAGGFNADPNQTVADYLRTWLTAKALVLKPTTMARYRDYVHNDLVPAFGTLKLDELRHRHISAFVTGQLAAGRGRTTLYRCLATLSSALGDAVRQHRLAHTRPTRRPCGGRPRRSAGSGPPTRRSASSGTATRPTRTWPTCSSSSSAPACARAKPSACTGTTSTYARASSTCAAHSPRSTTTDSSSPRPRPAPAGTGWPSHPASRPPSDAGPGPRIAPTAAQAIRSPDSSSADPMVGRCGRTPSSTGSGNCPTKRVFPG